MKQCPTCNLIYHADDVFCPNDGSVLVQQNRVIVSLEDDQPEILTQHVSVPRQAPAQSSPGWLYALLGGLVAIILMGGAYIFVILPRERAEEKAGVDTTSNPANSSVVSSPIATEPIKPAPNAVMPAYNSMKPVNIAPAANVAPAYNAASAAPQIKQRFTQTYSGTVGGDGIEMDLVRNRSSLSGKVRPRGRYADIYVEGYVDKDGSFSMDEKSDIGLITGIYTGQFNSDGSVSGVWSKPDGGKTRTFYLRRR